MIEIIFFSIFTFLYYTSAGILFSKYILDLKVDEETNLFKFALYGSILLAFLALFFNFFIKLEKSLNTIIFFIFIIYLVLIERKILKKIIIYSLLVGLFCGILLIYENVYRPDAGLYHLPFISTLNNEKIIIGLSNIHYRFGHTSIIQYLSALNNNLIFNDNGIILPSALIYIAFLFYLFHEIKFSEDKNILLFNLLLFSYLCLKLNRYSDFGNDAPAHIYYFFLTALSVNNFKNINKERVSEIITLATYIVFNKITLFFGSLVALILLIFKKNFFYFKLKPIIFIIIFAFAFFLKNFLISGCLAFPIEKTCNTKVIWFDSGSDGKSMAKITEIENEAWTKGWSDQVKNIKTYEVYSSDFNWIDTWSKNHGKRTLIKLIPYLVFIVFVSFIFFINNSKFTSNNNIYKSSLEKNLFYSFLILNLLGSVIWFLKFPIYRYGYSYLILFIIFSIVIVVYDSNTKLNIFKIKKYTNYLLIFLISILVLKNFVRIIKNFSENHYDSYWPNIYSFSKDNKKQIYEEIKINDEILFYLSKNGLCMYGPSPCTHYKNKSIKLKRINNYKLYYRINK